MKKKVKSTPIGIFFMIVLSIMLFFGAVNLVWYITVNKPYNEYIGVVDEFDSGNVPSLSSSIRYEKVIDGYRYAVKKPTYLDFSGCLIVSYEELPEIKINPETNEVLGSNGLYIALYIWPGMWGNYEYGVMFDDEYCGIFEQIMLDEDLVYLPSNIYDTEGNEKREKLLNDNLQEIEQMFNSAKDLWKLK